MKMKEIKQVRQVLLEYDIVVPMHYMHDDRVNILNIVKVDSWLKILNHNACIRIRQLRLNKWGSRGGKPKGKLLWTSLNGQTGLTTTTSDPCLQW